MPTSAAPNTTLEAITTAKEFQALWDRIKHKTTYRVRFSNENW